MPLMAPIMLERRFRAVYSMMRVGRHLEENTAVVTKALYGLALVSAVGFALSLLVHLGAWVGVAPPKAAWGLHIGIFVVWVPTVLVSQQLTRHFTRRELWKAALRGAPAWTAIALKCLMVYAIANFVLFMFQDTQGQESNDALQARGFSGHWLMFYGAAAAVLYSAAQLREHGDRPRVCFNGHAVSLTAHFCEQCGAPV